LRNSSRRGPATLFSAIVALAVLAGCGRGGEPPTRTPVPTWTPTPIGAAAPVQAAPAAGAPDQGQAAGLPALQPIPATATPLPLPTEPPTATDPPPPTDTPVPATDTPTPVPTIAPTDTPVPPTATATETPTPAPTPTPTYDFILEASERFPTESLAADVVRIWLYAYSPAELGLPGFTLRVNHNGAPLAVEEQSTGGVPEQTRNTPGPFTRFTNMSVIFVAPQAGQWEVQLVDASGAAAGPPALFELTADELTRELYVRYKQVAR
jgi:hypothetical protein